MRRASRFRLLALASIAAAACFAAERAAAASRQIVVEHEAQSGVAKPAGKNGIALLIVFANGYGDQLPGVIRDANALAEGLRAKGVQNLLIFGTDKSVLEETQAKIRQRASSVPGTRLVYATGFGLCLDGDLVLLGEDMTLAQFNKKNYAPVAMSLSKIAEAASSPTDKTVLVFDTNPATCTDKLLADLKLPAGTSLMVTTGIGGAVADTITESGRDAFVTALLQSYDPARPLAETLKAVAEGIESLTSKDQVPILIGSP